MNAAEAGEDRERVLLRPLHRRLGPLGRAVEVAELLARADEAAIHLAGRVRPEPAFDTEQHRFVEMRHPLSDIALVDEHPALRLQSLGFEVGRSQAPTERDHLRREHLGMIELSVAVRSLGLTQQQGAVFDTFRIGLERAARPAKPRRSDRGVTAMSWCS